MDNTITIVSPVNTDWTYHSLSQKIKEITNKGLSFYSALSNVLDEVSNSKNICNFVVLCSRYGKYIDTEKALSVFLISSFESQSVLNFYEYLYSRRIHIESTGTILNYNNNKVAIFIAEQILKEKNILYQKHIRVLCKKLSYILIKEIKGKSYEDLWSVLYCITHLLERPSTAVCEVVNNLLRAANSMTSTIAKTRCRNLIGLLCQENPNVIGYSRKEEPLFQYDFLDFEYFAVGVDKVRSFERYDKI